MLKQVALLVALCLPAIGAHALQEPKNKFYNLIPAETPILDKHPAHLAEVLTIHDGDTVKFRLSLEADVSVDVWVRFLGYNAPELHGPNSDRATEATKIIADLMSRGQIWVKLTGALTFARHVGSVYVVIDGKAINLSRHMTDLGYNVPQND